MNIKKLIGVIKEVDRLHSVAGAFKMFFFSGDSDEMFQLMEYLISIGYIKRITPKGSVAGQDEIFVKCVNWSYK